MRLISILKNKSSTVISSGCFLQGSPPVDHLTRPHPIHFVPIFYSMHLYLPPYRIADCSLPPTRLLHLWQIHIQHIYVLTLLNLVKTISAFTFYPQISLLAFQLCLCLQNKIITADGSECSQSSRKIFSSLVALYWTFSHSRSHTGKVSESSWLSHSNMLGSVR